MLASPALKYVKSSWSYNPLPRGCVLYLPLWHSSFQHPVFRSADPFGHTCTVTGGVWGTNNWTVDGDDWIQIGDASTFKFLHGALDTSSFKFSIELVMALPTPEPNAIYGLVCTCINSSSDEGVYLAYDDRSGTAARQIRLAIVNGNSGETICTGLAAANTYPNNTGFHHVVVTYDQTLTDTNALVYVDAVSQSMTTQDKSAHTPSTNNSDDELHIGSNGGEGDEMTGSIGEVRIYNRVLSQVEITHNYNRIMFRY